MVIIWSAASVILVYLYPAYSIFALVVWYFKRFVDSGRWFMAHCCGYIKKRND